MKKEIASLTNSIAEFNKAVVIPSNAVAFMEKAVAIVRTPLRFHQTRLLFVIKQSRSKKTKPFRSEPGLALVPKGAVSAVHSWAQFQILNLPAYMERPMPFRFALRLVVVLLFLQASGTPQTPATSNQRLSGMWEGTVQMLQVGECSTGKGRGAVYPYRIFLTFGEEGSVIGEPIFTAGPNAGNKDVDARWTGKVHPDQTIEVLVPIKSTCGAQPRKTETTYTGQITEKKGKYELRIEGATAICPEMKCTFKYTFQVQKKR